MVSFQVRVWVEELGEAHSSGRARCISVLDLSSAAAVYQMTETRGRIAREEAPTVCHTNTYTSPSHMEWDVPLEHLGRKAMSS